MTKQASQRDERKTTHFNENRNKRSFVFNTLLQHFSTIKKEHPPYSQNLIASLFAVSVRCKPFLSPSDFRLVGSMRTLHDPTQFGCIGQPSQLKLTINTCQNFSILPVRLVICLYCLFVFLFFGGETGERK